MEPNDRKNETAYQNGREVQSKTSQDPQAPASMAHKVLQMLEQLGQSSASTRAPSDSEETRTHQFWNTQPVPQSASDLLPAKNKSSETLSEGPINKCDDLSKVPSDPVPLPSSNLSWITLDITDEGQMSELYKLLNQNYVEDVESMFRFDYPPQFLQWALCPPDANPSWNLGVIRNDLDANEAASVSETLWKGCLVAFISAIPCKIQTPQAHLLKTVEVNFLCVHKSLRSQRLAPILIREVTRRVNQGSIFQALYTAGTLLPHPVSKARYWHRPLNYRKLCETGFASLPSDRSMIQMERHFHLARTHRVARLRPMSLADVPKVTQLLNEFMAKFSLSLVMDEAEVTHWLIPRDRIVYSFVAESEDMEVYEFISFYSLPSTVVKPRQHGRINVAYLFYYAVALEHLEHLVHAALVIARDMGFDVFNCVEIMYNQKFLRSLQFSEGDGYLHYYLYNWRMKLLPSDSVAIVML